MDIFFDVLGRNIVFQFVNKEDVFSYGCGSASMCVNVSPAASFLLLQEFALFDSSIFTLGIHHLHQEGMFHSCLLVGLIVSRNTHKLLLIWIREDLMIYYILGQIQELHFHFF